MGRPAKVEIQQWMLLDLDVWRAHEKEAKPDARDNRDGTEFLAYNPLDFPPQLIIGADPDPLQQRHPGAIGRGNSEIRCCKCGMYGYVDIDIGDGRVRRDCLHCGHFRCFTKWY